VETSTPKAFFIDRTGDRIVLCVAFSPNGKALAVGKSDGDVQLISLLDYGALCCASLFLHAKVAPYVLLEIANFYIANNKQQCIDEEAAFMHFEKVSLLERLQAKIKK
jgi:WD40 repeat protein